jgi:hypothetical protein
VTATVPKPATLKRYGLTADEWLAILERQGGVCAICRKLPTTGRLCVEHQHAPKWRHMPDDERKRYVRGLCCYVCNTQYLGRGLTVEKARNVVAYLEAFEARLAAANDNGASDKSCPAASRNLRE